MWAVKKVSWEACGEEGESDLFAGPKRLEASGIWIGGREGILGRLIGWFLEVIMGRVHEAVPRRQTRRMDSRPGREGQRGEGGAGYLARGRARRRQIATHSASARPRPHHHVTPSGLPFPRNSFIKHPRSWKISRHRAHMPTGDIYPFDSPQQRHRRVQLGRRLCVRYSTSRCPPQLCIMHKLCPRYFSVFHGCG